ncbi:KinB-signaling pathway activation protein [Bacillus sp. FJAT-49736]|uniref:KinB-signaling pathway activation protein n=1 Tax=Bacillus sp. FJAT-49736 TaxID=2833582 RepID=UPI001BC92384|nr:KinB-signaling pathway activation protein [Bacillus sp. FJAT-49736]MBS4175661.1 KinB-signaling pathway activation protein [Bacillus sp. FJAT-49736]
MTSRNWVRLFFSTLFVGGLTTGILGFVIRWSEFQKYFVHLNITSILSTFIWLVGVGLIFSVISQVGFFAYLTIHQFGLGIFRSLWNAVQVVLILFALFDLVYFRFERFAKHSDSIMPYIGLAIFILIAGLVIAFFKAKQSQKNTFISALFFMVVVTIVEWVPVLRVNEESWIFLMIYPLIFCNAYQILVLPKYLKKSEAEREQAKQRMEARKAIKAKKHEEK